MKPTLKLTVSLRTFTPDLNDPSNLGSMGDISTEVAKFFFPMDWVLMLKEPEIEI